MSRNLETVTPPPPVLEEGGEFAGYRVIQLLGRGGMGEVYEVEHLHLGERYALKVLNAEIAAQEGARERFLTEAKVMAKLEHRNLVKVGDCRETDGKLWLRMELAPGLEMSDGRRAVSLADLLDACAGRPMQPDLVRSVLEGILCGLGAAHAANLVHRDLKPSNILLWPDGTPKISDFGLVRVVNQEFQASRIRFVAESVPGIGMAPAGSATRALLGSYEFMSPEQKRGMQADARSDLYAVGLMAFRMLTGHDTPGMESASRLVQGVDPKWDDWLVWLLKPDPHVRCPGVKEALAGLPGGGGKPLPPEKKPKRVRKTPAGPLLFAGVVAVLCLAAWAIVSSYKPPRERIVEPVVVNETSIPPKSPPQAMPDTPNSPPLPRPSLPHAEVPLPRALPVTAGPVTATKEVPFKNSLGMKFVPVEITGGPTSGQKVLFSVWETRRQDYAAYAAAKSGVDPSWKNAVDDEGQPVGQEKDHPVVCVSWEDAGKFCAWLTDKERAEFKIGQQDIYRLPTDHEWSCSVGIGEREDAGRTPWEKDGKIDDVYPWGRGWPPPNGFGNYCEQDQFGNKIYDDGYGTTAPVGSFVANAKGLFDLDGNVCEWCGDFSDGKSGTRVLRGESWCGFNIDTNQSSFRTGRDPCDRDTYFGFRCVLEVKGTRAQSAQPPPSPNETPLPGEKHPETRLHRLTSSEVDKLDLPELRYAINEMFARHGGTFGKEEVRLVFDKMSWYRARPEMNFDQIEEQEFSEIERANLQILSQTRDRFEAQAKVAPPKPATGDAGWFTLGQEYGGITREGVTVGDGIYDACVKRNRDAWEDRILKELEARGILGNGAPPPERLNLEKLKLASVPLNEGALKAGDSVYLRRSAGILNGRVACHDLMMSEIGPIYLEARIEPADGQWPGARPESEERGPLEVFLVTKRRYDGPMIAAVPTALPSRVKDSILKNLPERLGRAAGGKLVPSVGRFSKAEFRCIRGRFTPQGRDSDLLVSMKVRLPEGEGDLVTTREALVSCAWLLGEDGTIRQTISEGGFEWQAGTTIGIEAAIDLNGDGILEVIVSQDDGSSEWLDIVDYRAGALRLRKWSFCLRIYT